MVRHKILIDTDIGDDIDDAFALALALKRADAEVVGITTVFRNAVCRAQQVHKLLETLGKTSPVYAGERLPLKEPIRKFESDDKDVPLEEQKTCQWDDSYDYLVKENAVDFILEQVEKYGKDLTIIPVGPLTNIARAIEKSPETMKKVGKIVNMGGWFSNYVPEWNILCDPEAADKVYSLGVPVYAVGLDVTLQCALDKELLEKFEKSNLEHNKLLTKWLHRWFDYFHFEKSVMHDPLAVACALEDVCSFEQKYVKVTLDAGEKRGVIAVSESPKDGYSPVYVATKVDRQKFYETVEQALLN